MSEIKSKIIYLFIYFIIFYIFFLKIDVDINFPITLDEAANINTFFYKELLFLKHFPNNHILTTLLGYFVTFFLGIDIYFLRLISLFSLLLFLIIILFRFNQKMALLFLVFFMSSDFIIVYSFLFRGYLLSFLLVSIIFLLLERHNLIYKSQLIYFISSLLLIHNISTLYIIFPIILVNFFVNFKKQKKKEIKEFLFFFIFPFFILSLITIFLNGIYATGLGNEFIKNYQIYNFFEIFKNIINIIYSGTTLFFNVQEFPTIYENFGTLVAMSGDRKNVTLIFIICISIIIYKKIIKQKLDKFDYIFIIFLILFFSLNSLPPFRIFLGFLSFFLMYIFRNIIIYFKKIYSTKLFDFALYIFLIPIIFFNGSFVDKLKKYDLFDYNSYNVKKKILRINCTSILKTNEVLTSVVMHDYGSNKNNRHYNYYYYLNKCGKKPNLKEFLNYYR